MIRQISYLLILLQLALTPLLQPAGILYAQDRPVDAELLDEKQALATTALPVSTEIALQKAELKIRQLRLRFSMLFVLFLALLLWRLWHFTQKRQKRRQIRPMREQQETEHLANIHQLNELRLMIESQEAERQRLARDLHDGLGGLLTTVKANVGNLRLSPANSIPTATTTNGTSFQQAERLIDRACTEVRRIAQQLMPQTLSLAGLSGSLEDIAVQLRAAGIACDLEITGCPEAILDEARQAMILRIVQELSQNITQHARASQVFIQLLRQQDRLLLTVEDDGRGFQPSLLLPNNAGRGLENVRHRVTYLNGELIFDTTPLKGTTVTINLPI